jgi:anti-sigma factor RsiW
LLKNYIFEMALSDDPRQKKAAKLILDSVEFPGREELLAFKPPPAPEASPQAAPAAPQALPAGLPVPMPMPAAGGAPAGVPAGAIPPEVQDLLNTSGLSLQDLMAMVSQAGVGPA